MFKFFETCQNRGTLILLLYTFQATPSHSIASGNSGGSQGEQIKSSSSNIRSMKPLYTQTLPTPNVKVMCIAAIGRHFFFQNMERERELERGERERGREGGREREGERERELERGERDRDSTNYFCHIIIVSFYQPLMDVMSYMWA